MADDACLLLHQLSVTKHGKVWNAADIVTSG